MNEPHVDDEPPAPRIRPWAPAWRSVLAHLAAIVVVIIIVDVIVRVLIACLTSDTASQGFRTFLTSPGMGGVSAVGAACIAFAAVYLQLTHRKVVAREEAWWKSFEWATERALPMDNERGHMPRIWSIDLLTPMVSEATTDFQRRAAGGVTSRLADLLIAESESAPQEPADQEPIEVDIAPASPQGIPARWRRLEQELATYREDLKQYLPSTEAQATLERYVEASRDTQARSASAEDLLYRLRAEDGIQQIAARRGWNIHMRSSYAWLESTYGAVIFALGPPPAGQKLSPNSEKLRTDAVIYGGPSEHVLKRWRQLGFRAMRTSVVAWKDIELDIVEAEIDVAMMASSKCGRGEKQAE